MSGGERKKDQGRCRAHLIVQGRVQGVGYRYFTQREAIERHLCGWVANLPDGRVEAEAEGEKDQILTFMEKLKIGPSLSRIDHIEVQWIPPLNLNDRHFRIRY